MGTLENQKQLGVDSDLRGQIIDKFGEVLQLIEGPYLRGGLGLEITVDRIQNVLDILKAKSDAIEHQTRDFY